jgi:MFS family permease
MYRPMGAWLGFINASYWLGFGVTCFATPWICSKYGRKLGVYIGYGLLLLGVALCAGDLPACFVLSRFFVGCASATFSNIIPLLINEIAYPTHRGIASALYQCGWYVGGTIGAFIIFGTRYLPNDYSWRIPTILQVFLPLISLPGLILAPQSPRWLISQDRIDEARKVLEKWHAGGDKASELVKFEMIEICETLRVEKQAVKSASYMEMFQTTGNRHRLLITISIAFFAQWAGNGVVSYYLAVILQSVGVTSVTDVTLISVGINIWNLFFSVGAAFSVDRLGRRALLLASSVIMLVGFVMVMGLSGSFAQTGHASTGIAVIPFLFIFFAGYDIAL